MDGGGDGDGGSSDVVLEYLSFEFKKCIKNRSRILKESSARMRIKGYLR